MDNFDYRLIEKIYHNSIENEDGPGSLQNVVSNKTERIIKRWVDKDSSFGEKLKKSHSLGLSHDSEDGWTEYSYSLERKKYGSESNEWEFVTHLSPNDDDEHCPDDFYSQADDDE